MSNDDQGNQDAARQSHESGVEDVVKEFPKHLMFQLDNTRMAKLHKIMELRGHYNIAQTFTELIDEEDARAV